MQLVDFPRKWRRFGILSLCVAIFPFTTFKITARRSSGKPGRARIIKFDVPGAGAKSGQGTVPRSINSNGEITGEYYDQRAAVHGFLRTADGAINKFDVHGARRRQGQGTFSECVNSRGETTGFYYVASGRAVHTRGFERDAGGSITTFDGGRNLGTIPISISPSGEIAGAYSNRGFVRTSSGIVRAFAVSKFVTVPKSMNARGEITGWYEGGKSAVHGFVRAASGKITTFDVGPRVFTTPVSINSAGEVTGYYKTTSSATHGFVRSADGAIHVFDVGTNSFTVPYCINDRGEITGVYYQPGSLVHGFVRARDGTITPFDVPGAAKRFAGDGTIPLGINERGEIIGWYSDANGAYHGFLRIPAK